MSTETSSEGDDGTGEHTNNKDETIVDQLGDLQLEGDHISLEGLGFLEASALDIMTEARDEWKQKAEENAKQLDTLQKRHNASLKTHSVLGPEVVGRITLLEQEKRQLKAENIALKGRLTELERENAMLAHDSNSKSNRLHGANQKVRKEKSNASKEREKAKTAVHDKNEKLKAGRDWRKERNEALAALAEEKKLIRALSDELDIEKPGKAHMREDGTDQDDTTVVIPIEFKIYRGDFRKLSNLFDANRIKITEQYELWYTLWKKAQLEEKVRVVGANYEASREARKIKIGTDIYEDMTDVVDEMVGHIYQTGAEHAGWRSKRGLQNLCKQAQASYNSDNI